MVCKFTVTILSILFTYTQCENILQALVNSPNCQRLSVSISTSCEDEWGSRCVTTRIVQWTSAQVELQCIITPKQQPSRKTTPIIEAWPNEAVSAYRKPSLQLFPTTDDDGESGYFSANITCQPYGQWTISSPNSIQIPSGMVDFTYISCAQHILRFFS